MHLDTDEAILISFFERRRFLDEYGNILFNLTVLHLTIFVLNLRLNKQDTFKFCKALKYFSLAESLGGVESLICHPATMTHASVNDETKSLLGINDALIRLSIGCEDTEDLISDILFALNQF